MKTYTEADMAEAWNSGYWHGTSHTGPLNDAAINKKNPHKESDAGSPAKKNTDAATETPSNGDFQMNPNPSIPPTTQRLRDLIDLSRSGLAGPDCLDTALTDFEHESGLPVTTADQSTVVDHCGHTPEGVTG